MIDKNSFNEKLKELEDLSLEELQQILGIKNNELEQDNVKLLPCPHEIVFTINASVLMENEKGEFTGTREICTKNYHIPVPIDKDYEIFMKTFFEHIENCLINGMEESTQQ